MKTMINKDLQLHKLKLKTVKKEDITDVHTALKPMTIKEYIQWELKIMKEANEQHRQLMKSLGYDTTKHEDLNMVPLKLKIDNDNSTTININDNKCDYTTVKKSDFTQTIKIKYFDPDMPRMELTANGDWIDCRAARDYDLDPNTFNLNNDPLLIDLGFACKLPPDYEAHLAPRSSSFAKWGFLVVNSVGVIDESYCGEEDHWMLAVYPTRKAHINKYDRVCQFRIMKKQPDIIFEEVENLSDNSRGGFGSTGVK